MINSGVACRACDLGRYARNIVNAKGADNPIITFVGEAPGPDEDNVGIPFIGRSGKKLDQLISKAGIDSKHCRWVNVVRCIPRDSKGKVRPPTDDEIDMCCENLEKDLMRTKPVIIVPLGATATYYFTGDKRISKLRGRRHPVLLPTLRYRYIRMLKVMASRGIDDPSLITDFPNKRQSALNKAISKYSYKDIPTYTSTIFPTYHPAAGLHGNKTAEEDLLSDLNYLSSRIDNRDDYSDYKLLKSVDEVRDLVDKFLEEYQDNKFDYISYDIETTGLDPFDPFGFITVLALTPYKGKAWIIPYDHRESPFRGDELARGAVRSLLNKLLLEVPVVGHNIKFDYLWSSTRGIYIKKIWDDTELQSWTLFNDTSEHLLEVLTSRYTDLKLHKQEMKEAQDSMPAEERYNTDNYDIELVARYNGADVDSCVRLERYFTKELKNQGLYEAHKRVAVGAIIPTAEMELNGCAIDRKFIEDLDKHMSEELSTVYKKFDDWGLAELVSNLISDPKSKKKKKFSLSSPDQISLLLFDILEFKPIKYGKKIRVNGRHAGSRAPSSDKHVILELLELSNEKLGKIEDKNSGEYQMWKLRFDVLEALQEFKGKQKLYSAYVKGLPKHIDKHGFVHANFGIRHTRTGRFNCTNPSLHIIPWHSVIKKAFVSRFKDGVILVGDFSQMELRVFAMETGDPELIATYVNGGDLHTVIAARVLGVPESEVPDHARRRIKTVNFGLLYGRGPRSIAAQEGISVEKAQELIDGVFKQFPAVADFIDKTHQFVRKHGYVNYIDGFRRLLPADVYDEAKVERQGVNSKVQGAASNLAVQAMINAFDGLNKVKFNSKLFEFKHDELGFDVPPGELMEMINLLIKEMQDKLPRELSFINVPLKVSFEAGKSWGELLSLDVLEGRKVQLEGKREDLDSFLRTVKHWDDCPSLVSLDRYTKSEPKVVRSLQRVSDTDEMVDVEYAKAVLEFPQFTRREPCYLF